MNKPLETQQDMFWSLLKLNKHEHFSLIIYSKSLLFKIDDWKVDSVQKLNIKDLGDILCYWYINRLFVFEPTSISENIPRAFLEAEIFFFHLS